MDKKELLYELIMFIVELNAEQLAKILDYAKEVTGESDT